MIKQSKHVPVPMLCDEFVAIKDENGKLLTVVFEFKDDDIVIRNTRIDITTQELEQQYDLFAWSESE